MHPKRLRQKIQKAQKYTSSKTHMDGFPFANRFLDSAQSRHEDQNQQIFKNILDRVSKIDIHSNKNFGDFIDSMESRDHYILLEAPNLNEKKEIRQKQIKIWLGEVCRQVFSVSFNNFSHRVFDSTTMKVYTSECIIGNLILLSKINVLTTEDFKLINLHLKDNILPYFLLRYPQSNNKEVNQKLNKEVSATDYLDTNENNMFLRSKIKIQFRENGLYYDVIMKFINFIQGIPDQTIESESYQTFFDDFNQRMQKLFTSVYNRKWAESKVYDEYIKSNQTVEELRKKVSQTEQSFSTNKTKQVLEADKNYEENVKEYTSFAINRKISENVQQYTSDQILHGNIKILHPSILRIIVKWCVELQEKFKNNYFMQRNQPFVMLNGEKVEMADDLREMLCKYASSQWAKIKNFLTVIEQNIYEKQAGLSFQNLMYYSVQKLPEYEESIIKFANRNASDVNHYAVTYLNLLIHGLMRISKFIFENELKGWAEWPFQPIFISFTISDLLRCKCFSKQKEILRIYKELETQSEINPDIIRVVKVKNRLSKGTKDILLNILFHQEVLCQVQLAIKVDQSQFTLWSDKFNHYIYQLQRSTYGPVTQMCSIWSSNDQRAALMKDQKLRVKQFDHSCPSNAHISEVLPFTCSICFLHYSESKYIYDHKKCKNCGKFWTCALCRISTLDQESLITLLKQKVEDIEITRRIPQQKPIFPEYFIGFQLESIEVIGQKFRKFVIENAIMFTKLEDGVLKVFQIKKNDQKGINRLFTNFIFFETQNPDPQLQKISSQQALDQLTLNQIHSCYKKKQQTLRITRRNATTQLLVQIKDQRAQSNIKTLSFPQNNITSIEQICEAFSEVEMLNLNKNKIQSMKGIQKMRYLTDLYLGQNRFHEIIGLDNLIYLKYLQLGDNPNAPSFKCSLQKLNKLESLTIVRSNLSIFPEIFKLKNLKLLWLFENNLKIIPKEISNFVNLQNFHLEMNQIQELPIELFTLKKIKKLMLSYNQIRSIPSSIIDLTQLQVLTLEENPLDNLPIEQIVALLVKKTFSITVNKKYEELFKSSSTKNIDFK